MDALDFYFFLVLKALVEQEIELDISPLPSNQSIGFIIVERTFSNITKPKNGHIDTLRRMWSLNNTKFDVIYLDMMAQYPRKLYSYTSWKDFKNLNKNDLNLQKIDELQGIQLQKIDIGKKLFIKAMANKRAAEIFATKFSNHNEETKSYTKYLIAVSKRLCAIEIWYPSYLDYDRPKRIDFLASCGRFYCLGKGVEFERLQDLSFETVMEYFKAGRAERLVSPGRTDYMPTLSLVEDSLLY